MKRMPKQRKIFRSIVAERVGQFELQHTATPFVSHRLLLPNLFIAMGLYGPVQVLFGDVGFDTCL